MSYPIIKVPLFVKEAQNNGLELTPPQEPSFNVEKPKYKPPTRGCLYNISFLGLFLGIPMLIASLISHEEDMFEILIPLLIFDVIAGFIVINGKEEAKGYQQKYENQLKAWESKKEKYKKNLKDYNEKMIQYKADLERAPDMSKAELVNEGLRRVYKKYVTQPKFADYEVKKGKTEDTFYKFLSKLFDSKIKRNYAIIEEFNLNDRTPYIPDIIYHNKESKFCIDIEIDEKYEKNNYEPIHFINSERDEKRNEFFLEHFWLVVRFSESQIEKDIEGCARCLIDVILKYDPNFTLNAAQFKIFGTNKPVEPEAEWTFNDVYDLLH